MAVWEKATVIKPEPLPNFVESPPIKQLTQEALTYLLAGFPIHFRGPTGTGKTTLAMHVAGKLGNPVVLLHGDPEATASDLVGGELGYSMSKVIDNFIRTVLKTHEDVQRRWVDNRLTVACRYGFTLIYDEYTRARPDTNNILLSVLQERVLDLPARRDGGENYLMIHPNFAAIFTSNPEEYAGVHPSPDALRDRMLTLDLDYFDQETEVAITEIKAGVERAVAEKVVDAVRSLRESGKAEIAPTVRTAITVARAIRLLGNGHVDLHGSFFATNFAELLASQTSRTGRREQREEVRQYIRELVVT